MSMPSEFKEKIQILVGNSPRKASEQQPLQPFSEMVMDFLAALSEKLLAAENRSAYPDLAALGFWLRPASIRKIQHKQQSRNYLLKPAGLVFHIAPSNVDVMFVYSWVLSLLAGNNSIIRLSRDETEQRNGLLDSLKEVLNESAYNLIKKRISLLTYAHDDNITEWLSSLCDRRVIWGGDETVRRIRAIPLPALANDIVFPDRISCAVINAEKFSEATLKDQQDVCALLYRDIYAFNQQACSSPRSLFWLGSQDAIKTAKENFIQVFRFYLEMHPVNLTSPDIMEKITTVQSMAIESEMVITRLGTDLFLINSEFGYDIPESLHCGRGLLFEKSVNSIEGVTEQLGKKYQTLGYWGLQNEEIYTWLESTSGYVPDRIVPLGQALNFNETWDAKDLLVSFSRIISVM